MIFLSSPDFLDSESAKVLHKRVFALLRPEKPMRLFYLQLMCFCLRFVFFTYGGGTVSKKDQTQFPDGGGGGRDRK